MLAHMLEKGYEIAVPLVSLVVYPGRSYFACPCFRQPFQMLPQEHFVSWLSRAIRRITQEYLLVTADTTFVRRRRIARLICHEVSHMWYGDIVTPESFDELWLKEVRCRMQYGTRVSSTANVDGFQCKGCDAGVPCTWALTVYRLTFYEVSALT